MVGLLCREMGRVNAGFGSERVPRSSGHLNVMRVSVLDVNGIRLRLAKWLHVAGMA